jgi:CRISPR-associated protein Cmr5
MAQTLEQQRAADAWQKSQHCSEQYAKLAKGLPALIMNSGLMQVMAFLHEKGAKESQRHCRDLGQDLRTWLSTQFPRQVSSADFFVFMDAMLAAEPLVYQDVTAEAFAWLRWVRQMAAAVQAGG